MFTICFLLKIKILIFPFINPGGRYNLLKFFDSNFFHIAYSDLFLISSQIALPLQPPYPSENVYFSD